MERGVGADEVAGEEIHKVEHTAECRGGYVHGTVFARDGYDVLFEVDVGRELHEPLLAVQLEGYGAQRLTRGMRRIARKAHVLGAEHALGVAGFGFLGASDFFGRFFGLGEIDGDDDPAARVVVLPLHVAVDVGAADIRRFLGKIFEPFGGFHTAVVRGDVVEGLYHFGRSRRERAHNARLEQLTVALFAQVFPHRVFGQRCERGVEVVLVRRRVRRFGESEHVKQRVGGVNHVRFVHMQVVDSIVDKVGDIDPG